MDLVKISNKIIKISFYLLFFLVPLILTPWNYELFEFNKMLTVYFLTTIILAAWLIKMVSENEIRIQRTPLDIPIIIYLITQLLSTIFSIDPYLSIWGYYSRSNGGLLSTISYIILYYAFVSNFTLFPTSPKSSKEKKPSKGQAIPVSEHSENLLKFFSNKVQGAYNFLARSVLRIISKVRGDHKIFAVRFRDRAAEMTNKIKLHRGRVAEHKNFHGRPQHLAITNPHQILSHLLTFILLSTTLVSLYGIAEHFGIDKHLWVQDVQNRVFSTLGQPNWLAAYLCSILPITIALFLSPNSLTPPNSQKSSKKKRRGEPIKFLLDNFLKKASNIHFRALRKSAKTASGSPKDLRADFQRVRQKVFSKLSLGFGRTSSLKCDMRAFLLFSLSLLFYLCLLFTKSRSGFLAFWLTNSLFTFFTLSILSSFPTISPKPKKSKVRNRVAIATRFLKLNRFFQPRKIWQKMLILNLLFLLITFFIGSPFPQLNRYFSFSLLTQTSSSPLPAGRQIPPGPALETGGTESGEIRKIVWKGAFDIARHFPLFGSGVETFAFAYYRFKPKAHNLTSEWDFLYNKAHNEYLNYAATTGFLGLGAYLFLIGGFIWWNLRNLKCQISNVKTTSKNLKLDRREILDLSCSFEFCVLSFAFFAGYASILITNFFGFSVVVTSLFFWLIPAISFSLISPTVSNQSFQRRRIPPTVPAACLPAGRARQVSLKLSLTKRLKKLSILIILFFIFNFSFLIFRLWYADTLFAHGNTLIQASEHITAYPYLQKAVNLRPSEPLYRDKLSINMINLATIAFLENEASLSANLIDQALTHSQKAITISPQNLNFWKTRTRLFYFLSQIEEGYNQEALESLLVAKTLAPTDVKITYNLALLYAETGDTDQAIKTLEETVDLKPNYRDARFALALFYKEEGLDQKAISELKYILEKINPSDEEIKEQLEEWGQ